MNPFRGVFVSAVTPHQRQGHQVDLGAMLDLVDFLCAGGVEGVAVLGATGEYPHFTIEDRIRTVQFVAKRSTVPVLAGVSHSTLDGAVSLALEAAGAGVAGVLAAPPHYYPYGQEEIREFYLRLAEAVSGAVPVLLHNLPVFTNAIHEKTVDELLATGVFAGLADAGGDAAVLGRMASAHGDLAFLCASDGAIPACAEAGVEAVLSSVGCAAPELVTGPTPGAPAAAPGEDGATDGAAARVSGLGRQLPCPCSDQGSHGGAGPEGRTGGRSSAACGCCAKRGVSRVVRRLAAGSAQGGS
ncbi:MAG: dihydrodipicolinate synthase family protein [Bryobacterales bacterium]|nr:dihydrodipicolinate synthase family protein [Bryobacterales bacterium]